MLKVLTILLVFLILFYIGVGAFLYVKQRSLIYFPTPLQPHLDLKIIHLKSEKHTITGWVLNEGKSSALLYFGGNAEAVEDNAEQFLELLNDYTVYLLPYRGYGENTGEATEALIYQDALEAYDNLAPIHDSVSVIGRSLGSGVATYVAANRPVNKLALITPFDSALGVAQQSFPIFPMSLLLVDQFRSDLRVNEIKSETLILIAEKDTVIPRANTDKLINSFVTKPPVVRVILQATHNSISSDPGYQDILRKFFSI